MAKVLPDEDIYVNDGDGFQNGIYYPGEPEERTKHEAEVAAPIAMSLPIMDDVADWFKEQIKACDDINAIQVGTMTVNGTSYNRTVSVEAQVLAQQLLKEKLRDKSEAFKTFGKEREDG